MRGRRGGWAGRAIALALSCHPLPAAAVTVFAAAMTAGAGAAAGRVALVTVAVLTGQLAIGWANDALDAEGDTAAGRTDKPVAAGALARRTVARAALAATAVTVPASLLMGLVPAAAHLAGVAAGLAYDVRLKTTWASFAPYLVFFGLLPLVAATAAGARPSLLLCAVGAVVGLAAHFANTVPDAVQDAAEGVRGLPQLLGPGRSRLLAAVLVGVGAAALALGSGVAGALSGGRGAALLALATASVLAAVVGALGRERGVFALVLLAAGLLVTAAVVGAPVLLDG